MRVRAKGFTWLAGFASASLIIACQAADRVAPDKATSPTVEPATMQGLNVRPGEERFEKMLRAFLPLPATTTTRPAT